MGSLELTGTLSLQALRGTEWPLRRKEALFTNYTCKLLMEVGVRVCSDAFFLIFGVVLGKFLL